MCVTFPHPVTWPSSLAAEELFARLAHGNQSLDLKSAAIFLLLTRNKAAHTHTGGDLGRWGLLRVAPVWLPLQQLAARFKLILLTTRAWE